MPDSDIHLFTQAARWLAAYPQGFWSSEPGFTVYDLRAGAERFVSLSGVGTGDLWACFTGWTPEEELVVLVCRSDEVNHGEDSSYPAAATAIRLYSPSGSMLREILPPEGSAGERIGPVAWNNDGSRLALAVGGLSEPVGNYPSGMSEMRHRARAIYVWSRSDSTSRQVADVSGEIESLSWDEDGRTIQAWFRVPDDQGVTVQDGVEVGPDGAPSEIRRPIPYRIREGDLVMASVGDLTLVEKPSPAGGSALLARPVTGSGQEVVVNDIGPLRLDEPVMSSAAAAVSGEVPDRYGEGAHWVYLVVPR